MNHCHCDQCLGDYEIDFSIVVVAIALLLGAAVAAGIGLT